LNLIKNIAIGVWCIVGFSQCQKVVEIEIPKQPTRNVVNVIVTADSALGGYLYETVAVLSNDSFKPIGNASMQVFDANNNQIAYQLLSPNGAYFSNALAIENSCYSFKFNSSYGNSQGIACIPSKPQILSVDTSVFSQLGDTVLRLRIKIKDSLGYNNYYRFTCIANEIFSIKPKAGGFDTVYKWVNKAMTNNNIGLFVNEYNYATNAFLLRDDKTDGQIFEADFSVGIKAQKAKEVIFRVDAIEESLFKYYRTLTAQQFFSTDPNAHYINVFSNVSNGYGIVSGQNRFQYLYTTH